MPEAGTGEADLTSLTPLAWPRLSRTTVSDQIDREMHEHSSKDSPQLSFGVIPSLLCCSLGPQWRRLHQEERYGVSSFCKAEIAKTNNIDKAEL